MKEENYLEIKSLLLIIKKRIGLISLITVLATAVTVFISFYVLKPVYQAKCSVIVGKETSDKITESEVMMYQSLIKSYSEIAKSRRVAEDAAKSLESKTSAEELMKNLSVADKPGTQIIEISYKSEMAEDAMIKANVLSVSFIEESQKLLSSGTVKLIDGAIVPIKPFGPNKTLNIAIGVMLGLMVSVGLAFLLEYLDSTIKNEEDVEKQLGVPTLGSIPKQNKMTGIVVEEEVSSHVVEAYKTLRTNVLFSSENRGIKTLMVCSSGAKEGKTTTATNIAVAISKIGKKVLLVDCDLRKPSVHRNFNISNQVGLVDVLIERDKINGAISSINDDLHIITTGKHAYNPSELLSSEKMKTFIKEMEASYDYIIIDTPPIIVFTDALILVADKIGIIFVVSSEETKIDICKKSIQLLSRVNAEVIGVTLNKVNKRYNIDNGYNYYKKGREKNNRRFFKKRVNKSKELSNVTT